MKKEDLGVDHVKAAAPRATVVLLDETILTSTSDRNSEIVELRMSGQNHDSHALLRPTHRDEEMKNVKKEMN